MPRPRSLTAAVDALVSAAPLATRWMERLLASGAPPLTVAQYLALRAIALERITATELARRAGVSGAAVSQLVSGLEAAGYLERSREPDDRRRHALELTAEGRRALDSAAAVLRERLGAVLGELPRPEVDALARLLESLAATLGGTVPPRRPPPPPRPPRPPH
jgi:DNA-binding MarR family transcriptional regulator